VFVLGKPVKLSLMFVGKGRSFPGVELLNVLHFFYRIQVRTVRFLQANPTFKSIRLCDFLIQKR